MANTKKVTVDQLDTVMQGFAGKNDNRFQQKETGKGLSTNDYTTADKSKLDGIGDGSTTAKGLVQLSDSTNSTDTDKAATPSAVKAAYDLANGKQSPATSLSGYGITDAYTKTEVDAKVSSAYKAGGSKTAAEMTSALLVAANQGLVYNLSDTLTITSTNKALFTENMEGSYPAGTNIVVIKSGDSYVFDALSGFVDLSGYASTDDVEVATAADIQAIIDGIYAEA